MQIEMEDSSQERQPQRPQPILDILTPTEESTSTMDEVPNPAEILESVIEATRQLGVQDKESAESDQKETPCNDQTEETEENKGLLSVLGTYLSLAVKEKDARNTQRSLLLKDGDISQFLVLALMNDSLQVVSAALDVFEVLCSSKCNHIPLQRLSYFLPTLEKIARNKRKYTIDIRRDALNMLRALKNENKQPLGDQSMSQRNVENGANRGQGEGPSKTATLTKAAKQRGRETVLIIGNEALQLAQNRIMIERVLIKIKGIISLTFNLSKNYCIIRGKHNVGSEVFGIAIANLGLDVSIVYKNELQEDVVVPISSDGNNDISKDMPDYLPEDDKENSSVAADAVCNKNAHLENTKDASIFNSALNFVRSSFYW